MTTKGAIDALQSVGKLVGRASGQLLTLSQRCQEDKALPSSWLTYLDSLSEELAYEEMAIAENVKMLQKQLEREGK